MANLPDYYDHDSPLVSGIKIKHNTYLNIIHHSNKNQKQHCVDLESWTKALTFMKCPFQLFLLFNFAQKNVFRRITFMVREAERPHNVSPVCLNSGVSTGSERTVSLHPPAPWQYMGSFEVLSPVNKQPSHAPSSVVWGVILIQIRQLPKHLLITHLWVL